MHINDDLQQKLAIKNVSDILNLVFEVTAHTQAVVVYDEQSSLSKMLAKAYGAVLPSAVFIPFSPEAGSAIVAELEKLHAGDFVALIQSSSFRLNAFRIRVELFKKGIKVIEHPHLARMKSAEDIATYIDSLAYDPSYYRTTGPALKEKIDQAQEIIVESPGSKLVYQGPFEDAKLNIGDYRGMKNVGGQFPIGEVFTEPREISQVSGTVKIFAFGDREFRLNIPKNPIELVIDGGKIIDALGTTPEFDTVLAEIRNEGEAVIRELGFGMNRAFTRARTVPDVGSYERMCGVHLSLGGKHAIYAKEGFSRKHSRFHVDVFVDVLHVAVDNQTVYANGAWQIKNPS